MDENSDISNGSSKDSNKNVASSCARCKQMIKVGLKCIRCGRLTHKACAKLSKSMTVLESGGIICCGDPSKIDVKHSEAQVSTVKPVVEDIVDVDCMKIGYLEELLKQKDLIIENQSIAINALKDQIFLLKQQQQNLASKYESKKGHHKSFPIPTKQIDATSSIPAAKSTSTAASTSTSISSSIPNASTSPTAITVQDVSEAIHNIEARRVCDSLVNIERDINFNRPTRPRRDRRILVGSGDELSGCPFKAASLARLEHFHATNFGVDIQESELCNYLRGFAPNVIVRKLQSRSPDSYSSFKISVPQDEVDNIQAVNIWPREVILNRFFRPRRFNRN